MLSSSSNQSRRGRSPLAILGVLVVLGLLGLFLQRMIFVTNLRVPDGWISISDFAGEDGWVTRVREPVSGSVFRLIPSGRFRMGSPPEEPGRDDDETLHWVELTQPFYLAETETTQQNWQRVMGSNPSRFQGLRNPVERVSWEDAMAYCEKIGCTLPTESQWEYACRAGTRTAYSFGNQLSARDASYGGKPKEAGDTGPQRPLNPMPTRAFAPNAWGLHDMHGNVYEWCVDGYGEYPEGTEEQPARDPSGAADGATRVLRGGAWGSDPEYLRAAGRDDFGPGDRNAYFGFRAARLLE